MSLIILLTSCSQAPIEVPDVCEHYLMLYHQTREAAHDLSHLSTRDQAYYHALFAKPYEEEYRQLITQYGQKKEAMADHCQTVGEEIARLNDEILFLRFTKKIAP